MPGLRHVFDTSVLVGMFLGPDSVNAVAVRMGVETGTMLVSNMLMTELLTVLCFSKLSNRYSSSEVWEFFDGIRRTSERIRVTHSVTACRDPSDDFVLALALSGRADLIVTNDKALLALDPFRGIRIVSARAFVVAVQRRGLTAGQV
ncbi:putative toxin-antitoxin system toxin component, PIN family [Roseospira goensis]|uniref:Putative PIN family toxin of toxin-antitoxin system n=1 Tax=Roseospira goensis TaxID=391922 RepID=A0A7W6RXH2_9PROT|nr:putative toxin-antitoxin system toxin component, PIN family [Roseospira goensis]MBB4285034.1 putative PIN family toxin of toxin-antitoxin system [Roseospira goensis]